MARGILTHISDVAPSNALQPTLQSLRGFSTARVRLGGPRFDPLLSKEERKSGDDGIWLWQSCGKLIDSDVGQYTKESLKNWKIEAEAKALREMNGTLRDDFFPQAPTAKHAPIPKIAGLAYDDARPLLLGAGWQPLGYAMFRAGNGLHFWNKGYYEIVDVCPAGLAYCTFGFHDVYGNYLKIITVGEVLPKVGQTARVCGWRFEVDT